MKPGKHQRNKQRCQDLFGRSTTVHSSKQPMCFVQGQGQKREQKHTTKNFDEFHNYSPLLTIVSSVVRIWIQPSFFKKQKMVNFSWGDRFLNVENPCLLV